MTHYTTPEPESTHGLSPNKPDLLEPLFDRRTVQHVIYDMLHWRWADTPDGNLVPGYIDETLVSKDDFEECASILEDTIARVRAFYEAVTAEQVEVYNSELIDRQLLAKTVKFYRKWPRKSGHVYIIRAKDGTYKIGQSQDVQKRIRQLGLGYVPEIVHLIATDHASLSEAYVHHRMRHAQIKGEWFNLSEHDLDWLRSQQRINGAEVEAMV